jgi:hypothetical protein
METTQLELKQVATVVTEIDEKAKRELAQLQPAMLLGGGGGEFSLY